MPKYQQFTQFCPSRLLHLHDEFFFPQASWIIDAINDKLVPLAGHVSTTGATEAEVIRRAKEGV